MSMEKVLIIRHQKERIAKCSLRGLQSHPHVRFISYPIANPNLDLRNYLRLDFEGPLLTSEQRHRPLVLLDATWRLAARMSAHPSLGNLERRSLDPRWITAYPRRQNDCSDPCRGLASIEALYAAWLQMGLEDEHLLDNYHWKATFLQNNGELIEYWRAQAKGNVCSSP